MIISPALNAHHFEEMAKKVTANLWLVKLEQYLTEIHVGQQGEIRMQNVQLS